MALSITNARLRRRELSDRPWPDVIDQVLDGDRVVMPAQAIPPASATPPLFIRQTAAVQIVGFDGFPADFRGLVLNMIKSISCLNRMGSDCLQCQHHGDTDAEREHWGAGFQGV
jgi:hypothetical protein